MEAAMAVYRQWHVRSALVVIAVAAVICAVVGFLRRESNRAAYARIEEKAARRKLAAAQKKLKVDQAFFESGYLGIEQYCGASKELMEAERDVAGADRTPIASLIAHRDRMRALLHLQQTEMSNSVNTAWKVPHAEYYAAEAEYWVIKARAPR
jgi:hypothetical protein